MRGYGWSDEHCNDLPFGIGADSSGDGEERLQLQQPSRLREQDLQRLRSERLLQRVRHGSDGDRALRGDHLLHLQRHQRDYQGHSSLTIHQPNLRVRVRGVGGLDRPDCQLPVRRGPQKAAGPEALANHGGNPDTEDHSPADQAYSQIRRLVPWLL